MKIKDLEYFIVTTQSSSISEAAEKLYIAQPSLTKAIQRLEREIGVPLFDRRRDGVVLTDAGQKILPQARQMVEYYNEWLDLGRQTALEGLEIYVSRAYSDMFLPHILINFRQRYPELPINFSTARSADLYLSRNTKTPVISLFSCDAPSRKVCTEIQGNGPIVLLRGEIHCLVSRYSPLAHRESVTVEDLGELFYVLPGSSHTEGSSSLSSPKISSDILSALPSNHVITVESLANVISQVAENPQTFVTSFYPALLRYPQVRSGELVAIPFRDYRQPTELCLFYSKQAYQQYPVMAELITTIYNAFREFSDSLEL